MKPDLLAILKRRQIQSAQKLRFAQQDKQRRQQAVDESDDQIRVINEALQALRDAAQDSKSTSTGALLARRDQDASLKKTLQGLISVRLMLRQELNRAIQAHRDEVKQQTKLEHKQKALKNRTAKHAAQKQVAKEEAELENHTSATAKRHS